MRIYQIDDNPNTLWFTNYEHKEENELFAEILDVIQKNPEISVGEKMTGPSEDYYECVIHGEKFSLIFDLDYGPSIFADDRKVIKKLKSFFVE